MQAEWTPYGLFLDISLGNLSLEVDTQSYRDVGKFNCAPDPCKGMNCSWRLSLHESERIERPKTEDMLTFIHNPLVSYGYFLFSLPAPFSTS